MGKKYIVELGRCERLYKALIDGNGKPELAWLSPEIDLTPYTEPDLEQVRKEAYDEGYNAGYGRKIDASYQEGLSDAWEAARKIECDEGIDMNTLCTIFGRGSSNSIIRDFSASEAIAKIKEYEDGKQEIKVGDEVERILDGEVDSKAVFLEENKGYYHCMFWTGSFFTTLSYPKKQFRKTGRRFPEIAAVLEKMRGEQE